jgi:hypothetical protein
MFIGSLLVPTLGMGEAPNLDVAQTPSSLLD